MKAIVQTRYGSPDDALELRDIDVPVVKDDEVLIRVHSSSVNSWDWNLLRGTFQGRLGFGALREPKIKILGADVAGRVEAIGSNVQRFQVGDEVFGDISGRGWGGFAEYVSVREDVLESKSTEQTFEQAAATPQAAVLALHGLRNIGQIQPGHNVLINGAGGGVGTFAVQLAKAHGAEVTGVDSDPKLATIRSLGADHTIDYAREDFTKNGFRYDLHSRPGGFTFGGCLSAGPLRQRHVRDDRRLNGDDSPGGDSGCVGVKGRREEAESPRP